MKNFVYEIKGIYRTNADNQAEAKEEMINEVTSIMELDEWDLIEEEEEL